MQEEKIPYYKWCYGKFILVGYITNNKKIKHEF
jgi:hypothetical protein